MLTVSTNPARWKTDLRFLALYIDAPGSVGFSETVKPMMRFGAVICPTVRLGAVLKNVNSYGAVRCDF